jgi:hypothetical protein
MAESKGASLPRDDRAVALPGRARRSERKPCLTGKLSGVPPSGQYGFSKGTERATRGTRSRHMAKSSRSPDELLREQRLRRGWSLDRMADQLRRSQPRCRPPFRARVRRCRGPGMGLRRACVLRSLRWPSSGCDRSVRGRLAGSPACLFGLRRLEHAGGEGMGPPGRSATRRGSPPPRGRSTRAAIGAGAPRQYLLARHNGEPRRTGNEQSRLGRPRRQARYRSWLMRLVAAMSK